MIRDLREGFLAKAEVFWYNTRPEVRLYWRRIPKDTDGGGTAHLQIIAANLDDDDLELERYFYHGSKLVHID